MGIDEMLESFREQERMEERRQEQEKMDEVRRQVDDFLQKVREPLVQAVARGEVNLHKISPDFFRKDDRRLEELGDEIAKAVNDGLREGGKLEQLGDEIAAFVNEG